MGVIDRPDADSGTIRTTRRKRCWRGHSAQSRTAPREDAREVRPVGPRPACDQRQLSVERPQAVPTVPGSVTTIPAGTLLRIESKSFSQYISVCDVQCSVQSGLVQSHEYA